VITWNPKQWLPPVIHDGYGAKILAVSEIEFIGYPTSFEVEIVLAGVREAAERCAPSLLRQIHSSLLRNTIATDSAIVYYYRSPGHHKHLKRARG